MYCIITAQVCIVYCDRVLYYDHVTCMASVWAAVVTSTGITAPCVSGLLATRPQFRVEMSLKLSKTVVAVVGGVVAGVVDAGNGCCAGAGSRSVNCPGLVITAPTLTADREHCSQPPTFLYRSGVMGVFYCQCRILL